MSRDRVHVSTTLPERGAAGVSANLIVTWEAGTSADDIDEAIKEVRRKALRLIRDGVRS